MRRGRSSGLRRAGWTVSDQALTSVGNLLLAVVVARAVPLAEFGAFAIAFAVYLFALGVSRAVSTDPLVVRHSTGSAADRAQATRTAIGAAVTLGLGMGLLIALTALPLAPPIRASLLALGAVLMLLLVQDAWRFAFFAAGTPSRAAINDAWRTGTMLLIATGLTAQGADSAWMFIAGWGASAGTGAVLGCVQARSVPRMRALPSWWRMHKDLSKDFIGDHVALTGVGALSTLVVALIAGVGAAAALRGAHVAFGAVNIFLQSGVALAVPEGRRLRDRAVDRLLPALRTGSVLLVVLPLLWLLALMLVPAETGRALLGETWEPAAEVFPAYALFMAATGATLGPIIGLRVLEQSRAALIVRVRTLPLSLGGAVVGAAVAGAVGVALAMALATAVAAVLWWRAVGRAVRQDQDTATVQAQDGSGP